MKKITYGDKELWFGEHKNLGFFIYDKNNQKKLKYTNIRIFLIKRQKTSIFQKDILKKNILKQNYKSTKSLIKIVNDYVKIFSRRVTHCYRCQNNIDNINFEICLYCRWIKCKCNACGCKYKGDEYQGRY